MDIHNNLKSQLLPIALVKRNFVKNETLCNYELYLMQFINESKYLMKKTDNEKFVKPIKEDKGQCDAVTAKYELDFKLVESSSFLEAKSLFSGGIYKMAKGVTATTTAEREGKTLASNLHVVLREVHSYEQIENILQGTFQKIIIYNRSEGNIEEQINKDLQDFYNNLLMEKNLLLFIPEVFYFDKACEFETGVGIIKEALSMDYSLSCSYRKDKVKDKETYISCIYDNFLLLFSFEENGLIFLEKIATKESSIFTELYQQYGMSY